MGAHYEEVERLARQLSPSDQQRLVEFLKTSREKPAVVESSEPKRVKIIIIEGGKRLDIDGIKVDRKNLDTEGPTEIDLDGIEESGG